MKLIVSLFTTNDKTIKQFKKMNEIEGVKILDEFKMKYETRFLVDVILGKQRLYTSCKAEIDKPGKIHLQSQKLKESEGNDR